MARYNQARLDLAALRHNLQLARSLAPKSRCVAVVKANAYGHGAVTIAKALDAQTDTLAVACIEEALELRESGVTSPILLLEGTFQAEELTLASELDFWVTIDNDIQLAWLEQARLTKPVSCWLKIDTGMHRLGIEPARTGEFLQRIQAAAGSCDSVVLTTHFASADELDSGQTEAQIAAFETATAGIPMPRSASNSAGVLAFPAAHYDWIRPGYMLYGNTPFAHSQHNADQLQPVMELVSGVISVRDVAPGESVGYAASWTAQRHSRIATVSIGYGDGYPRLAANGTPVLINGQRAPLAGRVSMDMITVDVTDLPPVQVGDEVMLWGKALAVAEVAAHANTIGYELTTRMPARTPRVVVSP
jgi:alanine racemase